MSASATPEKSPNKTETIIKKAKKLVRNFVFDGVLLILAGIALIVWPEKAMKMLFIVLGAALILVGLIKALLFFFYKKQEPNPADLLLGVIQLGIGIAFIAASDFFISLFQYVIATLLAFGAVLLFARAFLLRKEKGPAFVLSLLFGGLTTVFAVVIALNPQAFASFFTQLCGIGLILAGLAMVIVFQKWKTAVKQAKETANKADEGEVVADVTDSATERNEEPKQ